jgi:hypothetical protein
MGATWDEHEEDVQQRTPGMRLPLDQGALDWLREWLLAQTEIARMQDDLMEQTIELLLLQAKRFLVWKPAGEYRGQGYSSGSWAVDGSSYRNLLWHAKRRAREHLDRIEDGARYRTLDQWLRAEARGQLLAEGSEGGTGNLPCKLRRALYESSRARRATALRQCRICRASFRPNTKDRIVTRCEQCAPQKVPRSAMHSATPKQILPIELYHLIAHYSPQYRSKLAKAWRNISRENQNVILWRIERKEHINTIVDRVLRLLPA